jgi:hypothetical protein
MARRPASDSPPRTDPLSRDRTADMLKKLRRLNKEAGMLKASIDDAAARIVDEQDHRARKEE